MEDWARCLSSFLAGRGVARAHIVGLSWGGLLAQELFRCDPRVVASLVLCDTYAGWLGSLGKGESAQRLDRCVEDSGLPPQTLADRWVPQLFSSEIPELHREMAPIVADFHPAGFRGMATSLANADTTDLLTTIAVPTLLLWGSDDRRSPLFVAEQFMTLVPDARSHVLQGAGHVSNLERPDDFNAQVRMFCGDAPA
jgi:pimeloyl-ACP methyl ester carboxylesterase